ncbi:MAG TPA: protoporphyrinogen oxidase [Acidimicrobiales bacterium]|nr:protoporphyrinogen oxidase [Acidimicrobiales bacterium]
MPADGSHATAHPVVAVIGGGMSGLAAARSLSRCGAEVVVLEAAERFGGKVHTGRLPGSGALVELGPDQFLRRDPSAEEWCRELGLGELLVAPAARTAGVYSYGRMRDLPSGLVLGLPTDLDAVAASGVVSPAGVERARADAEESGEHPPMTAAELGLTPVDGGAIPPDEELSAGALLRPRLGDEVVDRLVDPLLGGINAGSVDTMSLGVSAPVVAAALAGQRHVIPALAAGDGARGGGESPFYGLRGGLGQMVDACVAELSALGVQLRPSTAVAALERAGTRFLVHTIAGERLDADAVVLAAPGPASASIVEHLLPDAAAELGSVPYASVAVLTLVYREGTLETPEHWSGVLVPRVEGMLMTAATWLSTKWPWMAVDGLQLVRVSAGRFLDRRIDEMTDDDLACELAGELERVVGAKAHPEEWHLVRWDRSFPQYRPGHRRLVARARQMLERWPGIELAGALLGGIGIPACISSGTAAASRVASLPLFERRAAGDSRARSS